MKMDEDAQAGYTEKGMSFLSCDHAIHNAAVSIKNLYSKHKKNYNSTRIERSYIHTIGTSL
jgi:hypothetical protein